MKMFARFKKEIARLWLGDVGVTFSDPGPEGVSPHYLTCLFAAVLSTFVPRKCNIIAYGTMPEGIMGNGDQRLLDLDKRHFIMTVGHSANIFVSMRFLPEALLRCLKTVSSPYI